jgi:hypothetical protein
LSRFGSLFQRVLPGRAGSSLCVIEAKLPFALSVCLLANSAAVPLMAAPLYSTCESLLQQAGKRLQAAC